LRKHGNSTNTTRQREARMRNSERLRQLELTMVKMEMTIELLTLAINNLMESKEMGFEDTEALSTLESRLDSGKWYPNRKETP